MRAKPVVKILLDMLMAVICVLLCLPSTTGLTFHEVAGVGMLGFVVTHLALNAAWFRRSRRRKSAVRQRTAVVSDRVSTLLMAVGAGTLGTGLLASEMLFPGLNAGIAWMGRLHGLMGYGFAVLIAAHTALHFRYLVNMFGRLRASLHEHGVRRTVLGFSAGVAVIAMLYTQIASVVDSSAKVALGADAVETFTAPVQQITQGKETDPDTREGQQIADAEEAVQPAVTLNDYLGKLVCTACGKHCSLLSPRCGKGREQVQQATAQYEAAYDIL